MGNNPLHGEKYSDFCARTNWHNKNRADHQKIQKFFEHFDRKQGAIYCYNETRLNVKQKNLLITLEMHKVKTQLAFKWFDDIFHLYFFSDEVAKEFNTIDIKRRDKLFDEVKFKRPLTATVLFPIDDAHKWFVSDYCIPGSQWYSAFYDFIDEERKEFVNKLCNLGFGMYVATLKTVAIYCTEEQRQIFHCGHQPVKIQDDKMGVTQIEAHILAQMRAEEVKMD